MYFRFFQELNAAYEKLVKGGNKVIEKESSWNVGDLCVAYLSEMELFVRAKIISFAIPQAAMVSVKYRR